MVLLSKPKFNRDVAKIRNKDVALSLAAVLYNIKTAKDISQIHNLVKLEKYSVHYRIKIKLDKKRDYRLGIIIRGNTVWLQRFMHRNKIYKLFP